MKRIKVLPPEISRKIAAGEIVERPVSVVKELGENSIDAGASEIRVELEAGGKNRIRVQDNGMGMSRDDALLCFERHSTSKISKVEDLFRIATLGFRGEALSSISAVSLLTLKTSDGLEDKAVQVEREGDRLLAIRDIAFPRGTSVEVQNLFFNFPARKKFLRSDQAELGLIVKYLTLVALAYPELRLTLHHGQKESLNCPPVAGLRERIFQLYGKAFLEKLMEIDHEESGIRIFGFSSRPPSGRRTRANQTFFVNKRPVKDRILHSALNQAFRRLLEKDSFAEAFLFLTLPPSEVDVNVHPAKAEVRFRDSQAVFRLVLRSIDKAVLHETGIKEIYASSIPPMTAPSQRDLSHKMPIFVAEGRTLFEPDISSALSSRGKIFPRVLGQYLESYIVTEDKDGLLIIDQHNAHERVLFEQYLEIDSQKKWPQAMSLVPLLIELSPSQVLSLENNQKFLEEVGFRIEAMGGRSFSVKEFPDLFKPEEAQAVFLALLEEVREGRVSEKKEKLLATMACQTAVKAGQPLSPEKMEYLVERLFRTSNPSLCPHGRPVLIKVTKAQIEKGLRRK
ncbi:MAG: DNA mismatch repair endonuclease MutL [Candidatus Aminicenantales bacterium]